MLGQPELSLYMDERLGFDPQDTYRRVHKRQYYIAKPH